MKYIYFCFTESVLERFPAHYINLVTLGKKNDNGTTTIPLLMVYAIDHCGSRKMENTGLESVTGTGNTNTAGCGNAGSPE
jgi:hypothetical protein